VTVPVADQQILRGTAGTLSFQGLDSGGEPGDPGTVTVGVTRADGSALVTPGTATTGTGSAPRTSPLTAVQTASLDFLAVTWTASGVTYPTVVEVVGGFYFPIATARARDTAIADDVKYPLAAMQAVRAEVEDEFERICDVAFVPRYRRQALSGTGCPDLFLPLSMPRRVVAVSELAPDGTATAWTAGEVAGVRIDGETGKVCSPLRSFPRGTRNVVVAWEHGYDRPPADVAQAAMLRLRHRATRPKSATPERAQSFQIEGGTVYRLDAADRTGTGIPDIDAVLDRWSLAIPGVA
jgi:hypothetical protein